MNEVLLSLRWMAVAVGLWTLTAAAQPDSDFAVLGSDGHYTIEGYLPGKTGWGSTFAGRPAVLWNPQAQTHDSSFGVRSNRFGFNIAGTAGIPLVVETTTNLSGAGWTIVQNCTLTNGSIYFSDPQWTNHPRGFYRIRSP